MLVRAARDVVRKRHLYALILPTYLLVAVFCYTPAFSAFYHSLFWWNGIRTKWVGLDNFVQLTKDPYFYNSIGNVVQLTLFAALVPPACAMLTAVLIYRLRKTSAAQRYQTLLILPMIVPSVVTLLVWRWIYSYKGLLNIVLGATGHGDLARAWLGDPGAALYGLMFMGFPWAGGLAMLVFLAGLQQIPSELIDAAIVDGVGPFSRFFKIELPLLVGQIRFLLVLTIIGGIQQFTTPWIMTAGGPGWATMTPGLRLVQTVSQEFQYGYGSAMGVVMFAVIFILTYVNQRYLRSSVEYEPAHWAGK
jgi:raffinose/stachyose/melibiose transport system permease protein